MASGGCRVHLKGLARHGLCPCRIKKGIGRVGPYSRSFFARCGIPLLFSPPIPDSSDAMSRAGSVGIPYLAKKRARYGAPRRFVRERGGTRAMRDIPPVAQLKPCPDTKPMSLEAISITLKTATIYCPSLDSKYAFQPPTTSACAIALPSGRQCLLRVCTDGA